jgi:spore maturation protein CgeB
MGPSLIRAADELGADARLVSWPEELAREALALMKAPSGRTPGRKDQETAPSAASGKASRLFSGCALHLAGVARDLKPHLTLALAQAPMDLSSLDRLREAWSETLSAFWFVEDYRRFPYAAETAAAWDLFFHIQGPYGESWLRGLGARKAIYLPPCADASVFKPQDAEDEFRARVSFMGAGYPNRRVILDSLARDLQGKGLPPGDFKVFGTGWELSPPALKARLFDNGRRLSDKECARIYAGTDVNLNIHSGTGTGFDPGSAFVNPRTFELAASGAFQICDPRPLMEGLFSEGELVTAPDPDSLAGLVLDWLSRPEERAAAGARARKRALENHLYRHRLEAVLKIAFGGRSDL